MKQLTILSGKGGTGKTSLTACFAFLAKNSVVVDCDVDAPDLHMLLHPQVVETQQFAGSKFAFIDKTKCSMCGLCRTVCKFDAITEEILVDSIACEGCGVCAINCPADAITFKDRVSGEAYISKTLNGYMSHALLFPGEANSGKLVTLVRQNAKKIAEKEKLALIIIDGPPGIGCPVIASISGVDAALIVTEPTLSGIHDLKRALQLLKHFDVTPYVCINMYNINLDNTQKIERFCSENNVDVVGKISFEPKVTKAMVEEKTIIEYAPASDCAKEIEKLWNAISTALKIT